MSVAARAVGGAGEGPWTAESRAASGAQAVRQLSWSAHLNVAVFLDHAAEEVMRQVEDRAGTIAGVDFASAGAAVLHAAQHREAILQPHQHGVKSVTDGARLWRQTSCPRTRWRVEGFRQARERPPCGRIRESTGVGAEARSHGGAQAARNRELPALRRQLWTARSHKSAPPRCPALPASSGPR